MAVIKSLHAKEILDSQGNPALQTTLELDTGAVVETSVPNGAKHHPQEAAVLLDDNPARMGGRGVQKAVAFINQTLGPQLSGQDPSRQEEIDQYLIQLDGTAQKNQFGANTLTGVSQVVLKAAAHAAGVPIYQYLLHQYHLADIAHIPTCLFGLINGGQYGSGNLDIQEFIIIPASHIDYGAALEIENAVRQALQEILKEKKANYSSGALGGFTPFLQKNSGVFELIIEAARRTQYIPSRDFFFGIDSGAENLLERSKYALRDKPSSYYSEQELTEYYSELKERYNLTYFEDPFVVRDTNAWKNFTRELGGTTRIAGDVITATNPTLVAQAIENQYCNTLIVKPSQIGTITETLSAVKQAKSAGWGVVVSQRTGETNDDFLADFSVGIGADFVKFGPVNRGEAVAKYNRLSDIAKEVKSGVNPSVTPPSEPVVKPNPVTIPNDMPEATAAVAQPSPLITERSVDMNNLMNTDESINTERIPTPQVSPEDTTPAVLPIAQAVETLPGAPQNTFIPQAEPRKIPKPVPNNDDPLAEFIQEIPAESVPHVPDPIPLEMVAPEPAAPSIKPAEIPIEPMPSPSIAVSPSAHLQSNETLPEPEISTILPPPTEMTEVTESIRPAESTEMKVPTATATASGGDSAQADHAALEAATQQAIDSTLAELGTLAPAGEVTTPEPSEDSFTPPVTE